jgi:hypothetical protein
MIFWKIAKRILFKTFDKISKIIKYEHAQIKKENEGEEKYLNYPTRYPLLNHRFKKISKKIKGEPDYIWGVLCGADLAKKLGIGRISVVEFGVAGGTGLVRLEEIAFAVEEMYGITIDVFGFDSGSGLPKPRDYRDLPHLWDEGYYPMDEERLKKRLKKTKLMLGFVKETVSKFIKSGPPPIAFIAFDLDLYSSTMDAFGLLEADTKLFLPRIHSYFDNIFGYSLGDFNGERLAIEDFNGSHELRKISKIYGLNYFIGNTSQWVEKTYMIHIFDHPLYGKNDGMAQACGGELPLRL